jgi:uncharacterized protein with PQ loop repeat
MRAVGWATPAVLLASFVVLCGCRDLAPRDVQSLLAPRFTRSEVFGCVAGFGTTFAAAPDLIAMLRRRSSAGVKPRMAAILGAFQLLWIYYGLLIGSRPVVVWNALAVLINFLSVATWAFYARGAPKGRPD